MNPTHHVSSIVARSHGNFRPFMTFENGGNLLVTQAVRHFLDGYEHRIRLNKLVQLARAPPTTLVVLLGRSNAPRQQTFAQTVLRAYQLGSLAIALGGDEMAAPICPSAYDVLMTNDRIEQNSLTRRGI